MSDAISTVTNVVVESGLTAYEKLAYIEGIYNDYNWRVGYSDNKWEDVARVIEVKTLLVPLSIPKSFGDIIIEEDIELIAEGCRDFRKEFLQHNPGRAIISAYGGTVLYRKSPFSHGLDCAEIGQDAIWRRGEHWSFRESSNLFYPVKFLLPTYLERGDQP